MIHCPQWPVVALTRLKQSVLVYGSRRVGHVFIWLPYGWLRLSITVTASSSASVLQSHQSRSDL